MHSLELGPSDANRYVFFRNSAEWYTNQNQFFRFEYLLLRINFHKAKINRQIRNFVFDLTAMPTATDDAGQALSPTGIHWQVSQACSLQNLLFKMPTGGNTTHVGIFMENGSGGFVSGMSLHPNPAINHN